MPELVKWVNNQRYDGGQLSPEQKALRAFYSRLIVLMNEPAFRDGLCIPLNSANRDNPSFGRLQNEQASGHWLYTFARYDMVSGQRFVVVVNLNSTTSLKDIEVRLSEAALKAMDLHGQNREAQVRVKDRLNLTPLADVALNLGYLRDSGVSIAEIPPLTAAYLEIKIEK